MNIFTLLYLDPGSGAMLLQMLVAGVAGLFLFIKYQGRRFLGFFSGGRRDRAPDSSDDA